MYVQSVAIERRDLVEIAILKCADEFGMCRSKAYEYLRAGRWLANHGWRER
jgi:hypothetical protein